MDVLMPQLGETVAEGKITKWFKNAGDPVQAGDNLFEIETDKTSMEVPATFAGTLSAINFHVGEVAKVGAVVAVITGAGEAPAPTKSAVSVPSHRHVRTGRPPRPQWQKSRSLERRADAGTEFWAGSPQRRDCLDAASAPPRCRARRRHCRSCRYGPHGRS